MTHAGAHWRWRMRHGAATLAAELASSGTAPDLIVATDMLPVAELRGHLPVAMRSVPLVMYVHEHQFGYPTPGAHDARDDHYAMTNISSALAADEVWWNSRYTLDSFMEGARKLLRAMPTPRLVEKIDAVPGKSSVLPPGIDDVLIGDERAVRDTPRVLWNARWEYDKGADIVVHALRELAGEGVAFTCDLIGPATGDNEEVEAVRDVLGDRLVRFGRQEPGEYRTALADADIVVSAARHEFFGIAVVEACAAGARPVVPRALAYPEVLVGVDAVWHDGSASGLVDALREACAGFPGWGAREAGMSALRRYTWSERARALDDAADRVVRQQDGA